MKKTVKVLLVVLLINILGSFAYAGIGNMPRPDSTIPPSPIVEVF